MLIGRDKEVKLLRDLMTANESQFVAVYGRRRVGKTYLIREALIIVLLSNILESIMRQ